MHRRALRASVSATRRRRRNGRSHLIDPAIIVRLIEIRDGMDANEDDGAAPAFERRMDDRPVRGVWIGLD